MVDDQRRSYVHSHLGDRYAIVQESCPVVDICRAYEGYVLSGKETLIYLYIEMALINSNTVSETFKSGVGVRGEGGSELEVGDGKRKALRY